MNPYIEEKGFSGHWNGRYPAMVGISGYRWFDDDAFLKSHRKGHDMRIPLSPGAGDMKCPVEGKGRTEGL
jgi:hypothetical protein